MTSVAGAGEVGLPRFGRLLVALSSLYASSTAVAVLGAAAGSSSSSSPPGSNLLRGLKRGDRFYVPEGGGVKVPRPSRDCTIEVAVLAPDGSPSDEDEDEIFQCTIDPKDVRGGYAGLTRKLDLTRTQKRAFRKMWREGRLIPGESKLKLAEIQEAVETEEAAEMGEQADEETAVATAEDALEGAPIDGSDIQIPIGIDVEGLLVEGGGNRERGLQTDDPDETAAAAPTTTSFGSHVGVRHTLVVKVYDVNGKARSESPERISDDIFGTNGDAVNLRTQMSACSMGRVDIRPGDSGDGSIDQNLYDAPGVVTVQIDISIESNGRTDIENAITTKVQDTLKITLPGPYKHVMYIVEKCYVDCTYAAYAYVNSYLGVYQGENYKHVGVLMHEIGHNFGLAHSGGIDGKTYSDHTGMMGNPLYQDDVGKMCYNPAKNWQIGWYNDRKMMLSLLSRPAGWETMVTLVGIADYQNTSDVPVVLKLETGTNNDYFVGFNRAAGINADNKQSDNELTIVQTGNNGNSYSQSWLKTTLQVSEQYTIRDFGGVDGLDIVVILDSIDKPSDGWQANVRIVNASPTKPPSRKPSTRQPSRKPSSQTASPVGSPANGSEGDRPTSLSASPSESSTASPTTARPTRKPTTRKPTAVPTTRAPTQMPTNEPMTSEPTTNKSTTRAQPTVEPTTASPTTSPSAAPAKDPTGSPTSYPTTDHPTNAPTTTPSFQPSNRPTQLPTGKPTQPPSSSPTTRTPTTPPSESPSKYPTPSPTIHPTTATPTSKPTSSKPTSSKPTSSKPTSSKPTSSKPTSSTASTSKPTMLSTAQKQQTATTSPTSVPVQLQAKLCEVVAVGNSTTRKCFSQNGNMFDVNSKNANITITSMMIYVQNGTSAEVWTKSGSYIGSQYSSLGWTKVGALSYTGTGLKTIPLTQTVKIGANSSRAFYVTATNGGLVRYGATYPNDSTNSTVVEDHNLVIHAGSANTYPFAGLLAPRFWSGGIIYRKI